MNNEQQQWIKYIEIPSSKCDVQPNLLIQIDVDIHLIYSMSIEQIKEYNKISIRNYYSSQTVVKNKWNSPDKQIRKNNVL